MQAVQREALDLHISFPVFHVCFTLCSQALCCRASCRFVSILSAFFFFPRVPFDRGLAPSSSAVANDDG